MTKLKYITEMSDFHNTNKKMNKQEAIQNAEKFLAELKKIEKTYGLSINSDTGDIYLSFKSSDEKVWDTVSIGWLGDGSGLRVMEEHKKNKKREEALSKLSDEEKELLGL